MRIRPYKKEDLPALLAFFTRTGDHYNPPISKRPNGARDFLHDWIERQGKAQLMEQEKRINGAFGYWEQANPLSPNTGLIYLAFIGVDDTLMRTCAPIKLVREAMTQDTRWQTHELYAKTWAENGPSNHIMRLLGGTQITDPKEITALQTVEKDKEGRNNVWYRIEGQAAHKKLFRNGR